MTEIYENTMLNRQKVAAQSGYIDWQSQPELFKQYPSFLFSYSFGQIEALEMIELSRRVTSRESRLHQEYLRLNSASAGNLHPLELYVQIRFIPGVLSGIYHVDVKNERLVLLEEINEDGLEADVGLTHRFEGIIFLLSSVVFRSEWKYAVRAIRYVYLDIGHQVGSIIASASIFSQSMTILSDFDVNRLNFVMGFKDEESVCAVLAFGKENEKKAKRLQKELLHVSPTDYSWMSMYSPEIIKREGVLKSRPPLFETTKEMILSRRSQRVFDLSKQQEGDMEYIFSFLKSYPLECFAVVLNSIETEKGIYCNGLLNRVGDFAKECVKICVDQSFIKNAQALIVVTSPYCSGDKHMLAGAYGQMLYLKMLEQGIGVSGIGAFYDAQMQNLLETNNYILYVLAVGR